MQWIADRLAEVSSWKGLTLLATLASIHVGPDVLPALTSTYGIVAQAITAIIGCIAVIKAEVSKQ